VALACEGLQRAGRPISQWTGREIADEIKGRGILEDISPRHAASTARPKSIDLAVAN